MNQEQAFQILTMGMNVLLTGAAGSGKTYLVKRFIKHCQEHSIPLAITASTGIAATHIGGMTIHSWSGMGIRETLSDDEIEDLISREYLVKRFAKTSVLIIDEISMLSGSFLASLDRLLQAGRSNYNEPFGGLQIVFVGDFFQLPPVSRGSEVYYAFEHPVWRNLGLTPCVLSTQFRQDSSSGASQLLSVLTDIRRGEVSESSKNLLRERDIAVMTDDHTELFTRNVSVDSYNTDRLAALPGHEYTFHMDSSGAEKFTEALKKGCLSPELLVLKIGARVMFVKNNPDAGYMNGSIGHVVEIRGDRPIVQLTTGAKILCEPADWMIEENGKVKASITQIPLRLAWAITVHKSQGMTLDTAVISLLDAFVPGQGYVALSRVRSLEGLILRGFNEISLMIDPRVQEYDRILQRSTRAVVESLEMMTEEEFREQQENAIRRLGGVIEKVPEASSLPQKKISKGKQGTHLETYTLIQQGRSLEEIAEIRSLKVSTIFTHLEKLIEEKKVIDMSKYRPTDEERLRTILNAFESLERTDLTAVRNFLYEAYSQEFSYDEIRFARMFIERNDDNGQNSE